MIKNKIKAEQIWQHIGAESRPGEKPTQEELDTYNQTRKHEIYQRSISEKNQRIKDKIVKIINKLEDTIISHPECKHQEYFQLLYSTSSFLEEADTINAMLKSFQPNDNQVEQILKKISNLKSITPESLEYELVDLESIIEAEKLAVAECSQNQHQSDKPNRRVKNNRKILRANFAKAPRSIKLFNKRCSTIQLVQQLQQFSKVKKVNGSSISEINLDDNISKKMFSLIASHYLHVYSLDLSKLDIVLITDTDENEKLRLSECGFFQESFRHPEVFKLLMKFWKSTCLVISKEDTNNMRLGLLDNLNDRDRLELLREHYYLIKHSSSVDVDFEYYVEVPVLVLKEVFIPTALPRPKIILR